MSKTSAANGNFFAHREKRFEKKGEERGKGGKRGEERGKERERGAHIMQIFWSTKCGLLVLVSLI